MSQRADDGTRQRSRGVLRLALGAVLLTTLAAAWATPASASSADPLDQPAAMAWDPAHTPLEASATLAADGSFTLVLLPEQAWTVAELSVRGDGAYDLGPSDGNDLVEVAGVLDGIGPLWVELVAVTPDAQGVSWSFEVQPELLPVAPPELGPATDGKRRRSRRARKDRR